MTLADINKIKFIKDYLKDDLFFTENTSELKNEIYNNCLSIAKKDVNKYVVTHSDMISLIMCIIGEKEKQIKINKNRQMIFYCWYDFQSGQLKLNFININHKSLPFKSEIEEVDIEQIVKSFLNQKNAGIIEWKDCKEIKYSEVDMEEQKNIVRIWKKII